MDCLSFKGTKVLIVCLMHARSQHSPDRYGSVSDKLKHCSRLLSWSRTSPCHILYSLSLSNVMPFSCCSPLSRSNSILTALILVGMCMSLWRVWMRKLHLLRHLGEHISINIFLNWPELNVKVIISKLLTGTPVDCYLCMLWLESSTDSLWISLWQSTSRPATLAWRSYSLSY